MSHPASYGSASHSIDHRFQQLEERHERQHQELIAMMSKMMTPVATTTTVSGEPTMIVAIGSGGGTEGALGGGGADASADSPVMVAMPLTATKELRDGTYEAAFAAANAVADANMVPFVPPRVAIRPCDNCREVLCCCMATQTPRCTDSCEGCTGNAQCNNSSATVQRTLRLEREAKSLVEKAGIAGIQANIMAGRPSGTNFPPSYDPLCIPTKSIETCVVHIASSPHAGDIDHRRSARRTTTTPHGQSLFAFFRKHPQQVEGHRDGKHGRVACFFTDLSPADTKEMFMSRPERALLSHNRGAFPLTDHPAQHTWEVRNAHTVFREVQLVSHSTHLPGKWSVSLSTAMPDVPVKMFEAYVSTLEAEEANGTLSHDEARMQMVSLATHEPHDVVTTVALTHVDLAAHQHADGTRNPYTKSARETLMHQEEPAEVVRADEYGFRPWSNCNNTKYWAVQNVSSSSSSSSSSTAKDNANDDDDEEDTPSYLTNVGGGSIDHRLARESRLVTRVTKNSLEHLVHAAYLTQFGTSPSVPVHMYEGFTSNCYLIDQIAYQDMDYETLLKNLTRQLHESATNYRLTAIEPYSRIEIASPDCTYRKDAQTRVHCAASSMAKFVVDVVLPFIRDQRRKEMSETDRLVTEANLRFQLVANEDISHLFHTAQVNLYNLLKAKEDAISASTAAEAEGSSTTSASSASSSSSSTSRWKRIFRKNTLHSLVSLKDAKDNVRQTINGTVLMPPHDKSRESRADYRARTNTFAANKAAFIKRISHADVATVTDLCVLLTQDLMMAKKERMETLNALFNIGSAHTWIDETDKSLQMFINYVDVVRYCVFMVTGFRWWTTCADLRKGLRVSFEWADSSISLNDMMQTLENKVWRHVDMVRKMLHLPALATPHPDLADVLQHTSHPEHGHVQVALTHLDAEDRAWFSDARVSTTWQIHHTPMWKHVVMLGAEPVAGAAAPNSASETAEATGAALETSPPTFEDPAQEAEHRALVAQFTEPVVMGVRAQYAGVWDTIFTQPVRIKILEVFESKRA